MRKMLLNFQTNFSLIGISPNHTLDRLRLGVLSSWKKFKNPRKTWKWVGGSNPNSDLYFLEEVDWGVGGWCPTNPSFSQIFLNLTRPLSCSLNCNLWQSYMWIDCGRKIQTSIFCAIWENTAHVTWYLYRLFLSLDECCILPYML